MSKIVRVDELSKLANNRVVLFWKKRSTKFGFVYIYISIVKMNIILKFVLATNNIMYVQQSEPKMEIKQRLKYNDNINIEQYASVYVFCLENKKIN